MCGITAQNRVVLTGTELSRRRTPPHAIFRHMNATQVIVRLYSCTFIASSSGTLRIRRMCRKATSA